MKKKIKQYRQGDVLIEETELPSDVKLPRKVSTSVLAEGEATGHAHTIESSRMSPYSTHTQLGGPLNVAFLVPTRRREVKHQEHAPIPLQKTPYRVVRQREYSPAAIRNVAD